MKPHPSFVSRAGGEPRCHRDRPRPPFAAAFTLVEMLVVIAIIALLLAALLPAFAAVRERAKVAATNAQFQALNTAINAFRSESALGGTLPPSSSDKKEGTTGHGQMIADPAGDNPGTEVRIAGAQLLTHALMGADGLGTPGFKDVNQNGRWSDDTHRKMDADVKKCGAYAIIDSGDSAGKEKFPRYPSGGSSYVDDKLKESAKSLKELADKAVIVSTAELDRHEIAKDQRVFVDAWDHPILYYRGNPSALNVVGETGKPGTYWQQDNSTITGSDQLYSHDGLDFGQGKENGRYHNIAVARGIDPTVGSNSTWLEDFRTDTQYDGSFVRFILDASVKTRPTAVQKDSYLLLSAGTDARYGTDDDVLNWTRKTD